MLTTKGFYNVIDGLKKICFFIINTLKMLHEYWVNITTEKIGNFWLRWKATRTQ